MIKGVNKQVLEISETKNNFFEKAIFFVKPEYMGMSEGRLKEIAQTELDDIGCPPQVKVTKKSKIKKTAGCFLLFLAGLISGLVLSSF